MRARHRGAPLWRPCRAGPLRARPGSRHARWPVRRSSDSAAWRPRGSWRPSCRARHPRGRSRAACTRRPRSSDRGRPSAPRCRRARRPLWRRPRTPAGSAGPRGRCVRAGRSGPIPAWPRRPGRPGLHSPLARAGSARPRQSGPWPAGLRPVRRSPRASRSRRSRGVRTRRWGRTRGRACGIRARRTACSSARDRGHDIEAPRRRTSRGRRSGCGPAHGSTGPDRRGRGAPRGTASGEPPGRRRVARRATRRSRSDRGRPSRRCRARP